MDLDDLRRDRHLSLRSAPARTDHDARSRLRRGLRLRTQSRLSVARGIRRVGHRRAIPTRSATCARWRRALAPSLPAENFRVEPIERMTFPDAFATVVISSAVLHFAHDDAQFDAMLAGDVARPRARRPVLLPSGVDDRNGVARAAGSAGRPALSPAGRHRSLPRRRSVAAGPDASLGGRAPRSAQDDGRAGSAVDDDVGRRKDLVVPGFRSSGVPRCAAREAGLAGGEPPGTSELRNHTFLDTC